MTSSAVTLELDHGGRRRSVQVCLGPVIDLPQRGEPVRSLVLRTDGGAGSHGMVESSVSWDAVLASAELLLRFEERDRKEAAA